MKKVILGGLAAGAVALGIVSATPGTANAATGEAAYLQALNSSGFLIYDTAWAIQTGHDICTDLNYADGNQTAQWLYNSTSYRDVSSIQIADTWVIDAVSTLCPWQYHPGYAT
jgi:hypothetical protein